MAQERGCGKRVAGGIYIESLLGEFGTPVSEFLIDPPQPADEEALGMSSMGVTLFKTPAIGDHPAFTHILDIVGMEHYPSVPDFIEEVRALGLSRRISSSTDFSLITPESRIILAHRRAIIANHTAFRHSPIFDGFWCPCGHEHHLADDFPESCLGINYEFVHGAIGGRRHMPSFSYSARNFAPAWLNEFQEPIYQLGFFASFPVSRVVVIRDREVPSHQMEMLRRASMSGVNVSLEDS